MTAEQPSDQPTDSLLFSPAIILDDYFQYEYDQKALVIQYRCRGCCEMNYCPEHGTSRSVLKWRNITRRGDFRSIRHMHEMKMLPTTLDGARKLLFRIFAGDTRKMAPCVFRATFRVYKLFRPRKGRDSLWEIRVVPYLHRDVANSYPT